MVGMPHIRTLLPHTRTLRRMPCASIAHCCAVGLDIWGGKLLRFKKSAVSYYRLDNRIPAGFSGGKIELPPDGGAYLYRGGWQN